MPTTRVDIAVDPDEPTAWVETFADGAPVDHEFFFDRAVRIRHCMINKPATSAVSVKQKVTEAGKTVTVEKHDQTTTGLAPDNTSCADGVILRAGKDSLHVVMPSTGAKVVGVMVEFHQGGGR